MSLAAYIRLGNNSKTRLHVATSADELWVRVDAILAYGDGFVMLHPDPSLVLHVTDKADHIAERLGHAAKLEADR